MFMTNEDAQSESQSTRRYSASAKLTSSNSEMTAVEMS